MNVALAVALALAGTYEAPRALVTVSKTEVGVGETFVVEVKAFGPAGTTWTWMVPAEDVVVHLPPGSHWVLDRYATLAHTVDALGWLTVWLSVVSERWLAALLLRCGAGAEVLEPERFVELAARHAREALARYR